VKIFLICYSLNLLYPDENNEKLIEQMVKSAEEREKAIKDVSVVIKFEKKKWTRRRSKLLRRKWVVRVVQRK
jgi:hypothetical protein